MNGAACVNSSQFKRRDAFGLFVFESTDCSSPGANYELYQVLFSLSYSLHPPDFAIASSDFKAQLNYLAQPERHIGDPFSVPVDHIDNSDLHIGDYSDRRQLLASTTFFIKEDIGSPGSLLHLRNVGLRLITLALVTGDINQSRVAGGCGPYLCIEIVFSFVPARIGTGLWSQKHENHALYTADSS